MLRACAVVHRLKVLWAHVPVLGCWRTLGRFASVARCAHRVLMIRPFLGQGLISSH